MRVLVGWGVGLLGLVFAASLWSHPADARDKRWLFVGTACCDDVYPTDELAPRRADRIQTGQVLAQGVDRAGNLYTLSSLRGTNFITVYAPRSKNPSMQFNLKEHPTQMAVAPDGTLYLGGSKNLIAVYPPGSQSRSRLIQVKAFLLGTINSMHVDPRTGILFLDSSAFSATRGVRPDDEYFDAIFWALPGSNVAKLAFGLKYGSPGFVTTDTQGRVIVSLINGVGIYCGNPWRRCGFLGFHSQPKALAYDPTYNRLYVVTGTNELSIYNYATGKRAAILNIGFVGSLAISPVLP